MIISKTNVLYSEKVRKPIKIIQLSDLHYNDAMSEDKLNKIKDYVISKHPDYIVFAGDIFFDYVIDYNSLLVFFNQLANECPVYVTLGNHDVMTLDKSSKGLVWLPCDRSEIFNRINNIPGVQVLHNSQDYLDDYNVLLTGVDTDFEHYEVHKENPDDFIDIVNSTFPKALPDETFNEISCHSPKVMLNEKYFKDILINYNADLIHCGHMHNGAVPIFAGFILPKNRGLIDPYGGIYPNLARGEVKIGNTTGIIGGPLTTLAESQGLKAKIVNTVMPSRINEIHVKQIKRSKYR